MSRACYIASLALLDLCGVDFPKKPEYTYEDIEFPEGHTKPTKEAFEAKFQEIIREYSFKELRQERNRCLADVDWVVIRATSTDTPVPEEWKVYMQALRDLPSVTEDPANPVWPTPPE